MVTDRISVGSSFVVEASFRNIKKGETVKVNRIIKYRWSGEEFYSCIVYMPMSINPPRYENVYQKDLINLKSKL